MAEIAFSLDGIYFSAISQDGRLRIWDTETNVLKQEYTPDLHLTSPPSCLQWIIVAQTASPQKGARRKSVSEIQCLALGTTSGKILLYSVAQAKVETVLEDKDSKVHKNSVSSLDWHRKYGLYSVNRDNVVSEWDLHNATVRNKYNLNVYNKINQTNSVSAIKIIPHSQKTPAKYIVTASTQIRVWRLQNGDAEIVKCLGHNASPKALLTLAMLNNTCWLVEGSQNERLLSFWDVTVTTDLVLQVNGEDTTPNRKKRKKSTSCVVVPTPTYNFVLEDAPRQIDVNVKSEENGTRLSLAAVTRSGVVHYYGHMLNGASLKPIKPSVTIQVTTKDAHPLPLQCCRLPPSGDIVLGYLQGVTITFEKVTLDLKSKTQVLIRGDTKDTKKKQKNNKNETNKVRGETSANDVTYVEPMGGVNRKRVTPGATVEVPMEQRLANLSVAPRAPPARALGRLLAQGLRSRDDRLILSVVQNNKPSVALHTVASLPPQYVSALLEELVDMATRRTSQCGCVCVWAGCALQAHAALLLAARRPLQRLRAVLAHRRSHLSELLSLKGRLQLTMAQREARDQLQLDTQPVIDFRDSSGSESELELGSGSESEDSWGGSDAEGSGVETDTSNKPEENNINQ